MVKPAARREAAQWLSATHAELSQRRAARLVDVARSTLRYSKRASAERERRRAAIRELAFRHPRFGYRRIVALELSLPVSSQQTGRNGHARFGRDA
jgi:hypothetical protein